MKIAQTIALSALLCCTGLTIQAQDTTAEARMYHLSLDRLVLLQNEDELLPLRHLDTLRPALVNLWSRGRDPFALSLDLYMPVTEIDNPIYRRPDSLAAALSSNHNVVIVGINSYIFKTNMISAARFCERFFYSFQHRTKVVLVIYGEEEIWTALNVKSYADAILYVPVQNPVMQSLAAQIIFGGVGARGRLPADLSPQFPAGSGIDTPEGLRLRYSPPELVNMDSQMLADSIYAIVNEGIAQKAFPGAQVLVAKNGHVVYYQAFGHHTYEDSAAVRMDDLYDLASITKISAATPAVMKLYEMNLLQLDAPLANYYPAFKRSNKSAITVREVLAHNARLKAWIPFWRNTVKKNGRFKARTLRPDSTAKYPVQVTENLWLHHKYRDKMFKAIRRSPLNEKPGYVYSDLSFYLWPDIVRSLTGVDFETFLSQQFYNRLGAASLGYNPVRKYPLWRIVPTERDTFFRKTLLHGRVHDEGAGMLDGVSGHAGLFGAANDLAKLMQLYLNGGTYGGEQILNPQTIVEFTRCQYCDQGVRRALGFDRPLLEYSDKESYVARSAGPHSFGHTGYTGTYTWADPDNGLLLVFFTNRVYPTRDNRKITELSIRRRLHQVLYDAVKQ